MSSASVDAEAARFDRFDKDFFDHFYRSPARVRRTADLRRQIALTVAISEHVLARPLRSVLDLGCGEGVLQPPLRRLRPHLHYQGVDASAYVVQRYGRRRNIQSGRIDRPETLAIEGLFDLVIANDVLHYLTVAELRRTLAGVRRWCGAVAYLPVFTQRDCISGDLSALKLRSGAAFRQEIERIGLMPIGLNHYVIPEWTNVLADMELNWLR